MEQVPPTGSHVTRLMSAGDASQILKDMLKVGKTQNKNSGTHSHTEKVKDLPVHVGRAELVTMNNKAGPPVKDLLPDAVKISEMMAPGATVAQHIILEGDDRNGSVPVYGREVDITQSSASSVESSIPGSSKVKITSVVNYDWEAKYYVGSLVAVNKTYVVYVLKIQSGYGLRILNRHSTARALLKGFSSIITDVAFAFHNADILGVVDQRGNLSVYLIFEKDGMINYEPKMRVVQDLPPSEYHRLVWCPYLPDDLSSDEDVPSEWSNLLAVSHDEKAEWWDFGIVSSELGNEEIQHSQVQNGLLKVYSGHTKPITDMAVSPDGSVLASASLDGTVKFWQMYWEIADAPPRCLHQFSPHQGRPVTSLLFCDNHKHQDASLPFWRFLITGADYNKELKVWCTVMWTCLQTIRFGSATSDPQPCLKVKLDLSASFLIASDIRRKVLYVIQLHQMHDEGQAHFSSLTEFLLMQPMLSFGIVDAGRCRAKQTMEDAEDGEELQSGEFEEVSIEGADGDMDSKQPVNVLVKMFCVFQRALQELQVRFQPSPSVSQDVLAGSINTNSSHSDNNLLDGLSDVSFSATERSIASTETEQSHVDPAIMASPQRESLIASADTSSFTSESTHSTGQPYLMTPESLMNSSSRSPTKTTPQSALRESASSSSSSVTHITRTSLSVDDLLSSGPTSDMNATVASDSSVILTPTPSSVSNHVSPRVAKGVIMGGGFLSKQYGDIHEEEDNAPKSPPPSPVGGDINDLQRDQLLESSENVAELLQKSARIQEKRISDSSAEVAQILGANAPDEDVEAMGRDVDDEDEEEEEEEEQGQEREGSPLVAIETDKLNDNFSTKIKEHAHHIQQSSLSPHDLLQDFAMLPSRTGKAMGSGGKVQAVLANGEPEEDKEDALHGGGEASPAPKDAHLEDQDGGGRLNVSVHLEEQHRPTQELGCEEHVQQGNYQQDLSQIMNSLEQMMSTLQTQQQEIRQLRQEMNKAQLSNSIIQSTKARIDKLEKGLGSKLESMFSKQSDQERQRLATALQEKTNLDKQKQERLLETVTQTLRQQVTSRLDKTVRTEIESKVLPEVNKLIGPVAEQLNTTVAQKLTATDHLMKENINKLVRSKGIADTMGQAAANSLSSTIQTTYRDAFHSTVLPAFERACSTMFEQINNSFEVGTKEYINHLEASLSKMRQKQKEAQDPILKELRSLVEMQRASEDSLKTSLMQDIQGELSEQLHTTMDRVKKEMLDKLQNMVREEIALALDKHHTVLHEEMLTAIRSQAPTPVPQAVDVQHIQARISQLLEQKHINAAFQHALNASDLRVVVFACNEVKPDVIFADDGCLLEQPVLLSLIQQLSQDLAVQTKVKCTYIDEALLAVDSTFPVTREHLPGIVAELCRQINSVIQMHPGHPQTKQLKRVLMQAQSLK